MKEQNFRPEINGLRAVAVLLVLLYHLESATVRAGFLGVDVFLVISGYLISRNILNDLKAGKFSFPVFYARRFKRLFPALFVTLALSLAAGFYILAPPNLEQLGKSVLSGTFFYSNIYFLSETGYFDTSSAFKPLLHIWSLSLEEQFYFIWPVMLMLVFRFLRKYIFIVVLILIAGSVCASELFNNNYADRTFYLLQFRMFEFLLGTLCIRLEDFKVRSGFAAELLFISGLLLILYPAINYTVTTPMPGLRSLVPCAGAVMIIYAGNTRYSGWMLRNQVAEIIGKTSYSIYLVHWPLIVYYKYYTLLELTLVSKIMLGVASVISGFIMWKFVENTFRRTTLKAWKIDAVWLWMPVLMFAISVPALMVWENEGYPSRYGTQFVMTSQEMTANRERYWQGGFSKHAVLDGTDNKHVLVIGNSHAIDLMYALRKNGLTANIIPYPTSNLCYNFGAKPVDSKDEQRCRDAKTTYLKDTNWTRARAVYLFDHWPLADTTSLRALLQEIRPLTTAPIYVFGPKMIFTYNVPDMVHMCRSASIYALNKFAQQYKNKSRYEVNNTLKSFFEDPTWAVNRIYFVDVLKLLDNGEDQYDIISRENSDFLFFDADHYTEQGAMEFGEALKKSYPEIYQLR